MVKVFYLVLICILFCSGGVTFTQDTSAIFKDKFKVYRIIDLDSFHLILAARNDDVYRILSKKNNDSIKCDHEIPSGKYVSFELKKIKMEGIGRLEKYERCECSDYVFALTYIVDGIKVTLPMQQDTDVYLCLNLNGLCPISP